MDLHQSFGLRLFKDLPDEIGSSTSSGLITLRRRYADRSSQTDCNSFVYLSWVATEHTFTLSMLIRLLLPTLVGEANDVDGEALCHAQFFTP